MQPIIIRILAASMVEKANSGHPGGAMGGADFINVLFSEFLVYDPEDPTWTGRDRFFLDPGHMSPMLYSTLALQGKFTLEELQQFRQWGSPTPGHPERDIKRRHREYFRTFRARTYLCCWCCCS
jgi:transketolase